MTCKTITAGQLQRDKKRQIASSRRWTVTVWVGERCLGGASATGAQPCIAARRIALAFVAAFASTLDEGALLRLVVLPEPAEGAEGVEFGAFVRQGRPGELRPWAEVAQTDLERLLDGRR